MWPQFILSDESERWSINRVQGAAVDFGVIHNGEALVVPEGNLRRNLMWLPFCETRGN
jgi:hypothetical protein